jgi:hypothetical protein
VTKGVRRLFRQYFDGMHTPFAGLKDGTEQRLVTAEGKRTSPLEAPR